MSLLKQPNEIAKHVLVKGLIYGQPGVGKSTLALSAPNPVMIDADNGIYRVEKRFQVPSLPLNDYDSLLALMESPELAPFDSIVVDTLGKLVDRIAESLMAKNPKLKQSDGTLQLKGYGALKKEFQRFLSLAQTKGKHLIFVAHDKEEKDGENRIVRPDVSGSSGKELIKELDFVGYIEMAGRKTTISFTPSEKFYAKNSLQLPAVIDVPRTETSPNDFIQRYIIDRTVARLEEDNKTAETYDLLISNVKKRIAAVKDPAGANAVLKEITHAMVVWDSERVLKRFLFERSKEIGVVYDKETASFVVPAETEEKAA